MRWKRFVLNSSGASSLFQPRWRRGQKQWRCWHFSDLTLIPTGKRFWLNYSLSFLFWPTPWLKRAEETTNALYLLFNLNFQGVHLKWMFRPGAVVTKVGHRDLVACLSDSISTVRWPSKLKLLRKQVLASAPRCAEGKAAFHLALASKPFLDSSRIPFTF